MLRAPTAALNSSPCAPQVRMGELCSALGQVMGRPSLVPVPDFALRTLLGEVRHRRRALLGCAASAACVRRDRCATAGRPHPAPPQLLRSTLTPPLPLPPILDTRAGRVGGAGGPARGAVARAGGRFHVPLLAGGLRGRPSLPRGGSVRGMARRAAQPRMRVGKSAAHTLPSPRRRGRRWAMRCGTCCAPDRFACCCSGTILVYGNTLTRMAVCRH